MNSVKKTREKPPTVSSDEVSLLASEGWKSSQLRYQFNIESICNKVNKPYYVSLLNWGCSVSRLFSICSSFLK